MSELTLYINLPDQFNGKNTHKWSKEELYKLYDVKYKHQCGMPHISFGTRKTTMMGMMHLQDTSNLIKYYYFKYRQNIKNKIKGSECPICLERVKHPKFTFEAKNNVEIVYCLKCIVEYVEKMKKAYDPSTRIDYTIDQVRNMEENAKKNNIRCKSLLKICFGIEDENERKEKLLKRCCIDIIEIRMTLLVEFMLNQSAYRIHSLIPLLIEMQQSLLTLYIIDRHEVEHGLRNRLNEIEILINQEHNIRTKLKLRDLCDLLEYYLNILSKLPSEPLSMEQLEVHIQDKFVNICTQCNIRLFTAGQLEQILSR